MPGVLASLPDHWSDPARAWPAQDQPRLPGPLGLYAALILVTAMGGALIASAARVFGGSMGPRPEGAHWATARDLRTLLVRRRTPGRLTLGRLGRRLVAAEPRASTIVIGPSQSGKTTAIAIPAILEAAGPVLAVSVKRDLLDATLAARRDMGPVVVYDPTGASAITDPPPVGWDPVRGCVSWATARRMAFSLSNAHGVPPSRDGDFWRQMATKLIAPLLFAAAHTEGGSISTVVRWLDTREERAVLRALNRARSVEALDAFQASCEREERTKSSIYATAEAIAEPFADPGVMRSIEGPLFDSREALSGTTTLYVVAPVSDQERLAPLFSALVEEVLDSAFARAAAGSPCDPALLVVLDEAANTAPIRRLPHIAATAAGLGVQMVTVFQDLAQVHTRYAQAAETVISNHRAKVFLSGIADPTTLGFLRSVLGEQDVRTESRTRDSAVRESRTASTTLRALAPPERVRGLGINRALLLYGHLPPAAIDLAPFLGRAPGRGESRWRGDRDTH